MKQLMTLPAPAIYLLMDLNPAVTPDIRALPTSISSGKTIRRTAFIFLFSVDHKRTEPRETPA